MQSRHSVFAARLALLRVITSRMHLINDHLGLNHTLLLIASKLNINHCSSMARIKFLPDLTFFLDPVHHFRHAT